MEFLLTSYIYPLKEPLVLSRRFGFSLDNPRTELETEVVKGYLLGAYESGYDYKFPVHSDEPIVTIEGILEDFRNTLSSNDPVVAETFTRYNREHIFDFLASIWVVARFEDEGLGEELRQEHRRMRAEGSLGFFMLGDDNPCFCADRDNRAPYRSQDGAPQLHSVSSFVPGVMISSCVPWGIQAAPTFGRR